ncbi:11950_t:CDS:2, partial [Dentiscutata erythropus]
LAKVLMFDQTNGELNYNKGRKQTLRFLVSCWKMEPQKDSKGRIASSQVQ